ncbi:hypothetical protein HYE82_07470 [Streptomyces sp. BR123]|uniref:hypothetical protein n=1 Tax=Streptomyces sp. BR123 TaxID=2749828 RepID=UPI0015C41CF7|nr:hypothetical protein [Streptomyces sp. BR123]NXY94228.1 hypothetical protein [Streptomyces sp. BR123]
MNWQWIFLILFSLTLLPAGIALLAGWAPRSLRTDGMPVRSQGAALLLIYATVPVNAIPRLADASAAMVLACTAGGGALALTGALVLAFAGRRQQGRTGHPASRTAD